MQIEQIGDCTLYRGDCLEIMPTLGEVDAVVTDPPYGIKFREYESHIDDPSTYPDLMRNVIANGEDLLLDGWFVLFQGAKRIHEISSWIERPYRLMAAAKNFTQILPGAGPLWSTDFAAFWPVGTPRTTDGKGRDYHVAQTSNMSSRPKGHPCPRPLDQMIHIVFCFSESDQAVLDPFTGSGTTGVACVKLGRKFIGIEIDQKYFDIACKRIDEATRQGRLFDEPAPKPEQLSLNPRNQ